MQNVYEADDVTTNNIRLQVGDIVKVHGRPHIVREIIHEMSIDTLPIVRYELDALDSRTIYDPYDPLETELVLPMRAEIRQVLDWQLRPFPREEEISNETRKEFIKLLE